MITLVLIATLAAAFYMGWAMGGNDAGNSMGPPIGARILTFRRAITIFVLFVVLGAVLEGHHVTRTIGKEIVLFENDDAARAQADNLGIPADVKPTPFTFVPWAAFASVFAAAIWVMVATRLGLPISTSHSIVGGVMGAGFALMFLNVSALAAAGVKISFTRLSHIVLSWALTAPGAIAFAYIAYLTSDRLLRRVKNIELLNKAYSIMVMMTACYVAYAFGANDLGNAVGAVLAVNPGSNIWMLGLFGGVAIVCGGITYSRRVIDTIGKRITVLAPATAFAALLGAALTVHIFTQFGIPVSTSHAAVGGVIGAGLVKGVSAVSGRRVGWISLAWVITPLVAMAISFGLVVLLVGG